MELPIARRGSQTLAGDVGDEARVHPSHAALEKPPGSAGSSAKLLESCAEAIREAERSVRLDLAAAE
jgi:hypothetical protein